MDGRELGIGIAVIGLVLVVVGLLVASGALSWLGRLPGDIRIESGNTRIYIPISSMVIVSIVLTVLLRLLFRR